jgi:hypothetical protein
MQFIRVESVSRRESDGEQIIRAIFEITPREYSRIINERNERAVEQANQARRQQIERENEADWERERQWYQESYDRDEN